MPWEPYPDLGETDDDSLIHWMLSLTPIQRLKALEGFVESIWVLRNGRSTTA